MQTKMQHDVKAEARGKWPWLLQHLGVESKFLSKKNGPCPMCGGKDRFRFSDFNGDGLYYCSHCGPGDGFNLAQAVTGKTFKEIAKFVQEHAGKIHQVTETRDEKALFDAQAKVWGNGRKPPVDGPVHRYLSHRLGQYPEFPLKNIRQFEGNMVARVTDVDDMGVNIHRTFLKAQPDGTFGYTEKKVMKGTIPKGSAIRLSPVEKTLGVAEGIETALSARILFGVPTWSVISSIGMINWIPPEQVETVVIFGDNDENYTGQSAAYALAHQLATRYGKKVEVRIPPLKGADWNDMIRYKVV